MAVGQARYIGIRGSSPPSVPTSFRGVEIWGLSNSISTVTADHDLFCCWRIPRMQRNIRVDILVPTPLSGPYIWLGYVTCERSSISGGGGGEGGEEVI